MNSPSTVPIIFEWNGEAMVPLPRFKKLCDRQYVVGETYRLDVIEERSRASHNVYFALIQEAWQTLPEDLTDRFPSPTHLRKYALCKSGYCKVTDYVGSAPGDAARVAAVIRDIDRYAVIVLEGEVMRVYTAFSQSMKAMKKKVFEESKNRVLDTISALLGTDVATLKAQVPSRAPPMRVASPLAPTLANQGKAT